MSLAPPGYKERRIAGAHVIVRSDALGFVEEALAASGTLYDYAAARPEADTLAGRQTIYVIRGPDTQRWILRHLSHGGRLAPITRDRFLRIGLPRPFNELRVAWQLREIGIPTPEVVAAAVYDERFVYRGDVAREEISPARDLASSLFGDPALNPVDRKAVLAAAGRLLGRLHGAGVIHPDLNLRNILIERSHEAARAFILDVEKCRIAAQVPRWRRRAMLIRLKRSARKFEENSGREVSDQEWKIFHSAYAEPLGGDK